MQTFSPLPALALTLLLAGSVAAAGCSSEPDPANGDDPLVALRADTKTDRYRQAYWEDAVDKKPQVFQQALAFCKSHDFDSTTYPNCEYVRGPAMLYNMGRELEGVETKSFGPGDIGASSDAQAQKGSSTGQDSSSRP